MPFRIFRPKLAGLNMAPHRDLSAFSRHRILPSFFIKKVRETRTHGAVWLA